MKESEGEGEGEGAGTCRKRFIVIFVPKWDKMLFRVV